jgi:hypothetical protein
MVTFIGSTFMTYGETEPYLNHCIVLNTCDNTPTVPNSQIETYATEREVLTAWTNLVQRENPDIIVGYNIFSFDYEFMFRRAQELGCVEEFLQLSRNIGEVCGTVDYKNPDKIDIDRSSTIVASGSYDMAIIIWCRTSWTMSAGISSATWSRTSYMDVGCPDWAQISP